MKFKNFVKSLASSGVIYNRGVEELPLADRSGNALGHFQDA